MTKPVKATKPEKPHPDFPLTANSNGQWCKKVRGKVRNFGPWRDPEGALARWNAEKDYLLAGDEPPGAKLTIGELGNLFLEAREKDLASGTISQRTFDEYRAAYKLVTEHFGRTKAVALLLPDHFRDFRAKLAQKWGATTVGNAVIRIRVVFRWGYDEGLMESPVRFGKAFSRASKRDARIAATESSERMFTAVELRRLIYSANPQLKAWVLLGINCGYGQKDIAALPKTRVTGGWILFPRPKTGAPRRCPLWPETIEAIQACKPRKPYREDLSHLLFLSKYGDELVRYQNGAWIDGIGQVFTKHLKKQGLKKDGINFYSLRRTFRTIADEVKDASACALIMGHIEPGMGALYTQRISDERLLAVTNYVRDWLLPRPTINV